MSIKQFVNPTISSLIEARFEGVQDFEVLNDSHMVRPVSKYQFNDRYATNQIPPLCRWWVGDRCFMFVIELPQTNDFNERQRCFDEVVFYVKSSVEFMKNPEDKFNVWCKYFNKEKQ